MLCHCRSYGHAFDPSVDFTLERSDAAPSMITCVLDGLMPDLSSREAVDSQFQGALREQETLSRIGGAPTGEVEELQQHILSLLHAPKMQRPANIAETSPDGRWLAVGFDAPSVVLLPAGPGCVLRLLSCSEDL